MMTNTIQLYVATQTLFRAFHYLQPRMKGGSLLPPQPMNAEALAGCILHGCMARLVRELQQRREQHQIQNQANLVARTTLIRRPVNSTDAPICDQ